MEDAISLLGGSTLFVLGGLYSWFIAGGSAEIGLPGQRLTDEQARRRRLPSRVMACVSFVLAAAFALKALQAATLAGAF